MTTNRTYQQVIVFFIVLLFLSSLCSCNSDRPAVDSSSVSTPQESSTKTEETGVSNPESVEADGKEDPKLLQATIINVVDGDTMDVSTGGDDTLRVRLIGLDAPESVHPDASKNTEMGWIASEYTNSQLLGKEVSLEFDVQELDEYGRALAYVWLDNELFNAKIIRNGYAQVSTYPPNVKYTNLLVESQEQAREAGVGMWSATEEVNSTIPWSEAINHIGETGTFTGKVVGTRYASDANGKPTFLNVGVDYPDTGRLTILIWGGDRGSFPSSPESMYTGKTISVTGTVELYDGVAEIRVSSPSQVVVLD